MAKLSSNLSKLAAKAPQAASQALLQTARDIAQMAKQLAPIDTGLLQRSYRVEPIDENTMQIGTDTEYAPYVEFGTVNQSAQPHLTPAFHQNEETFKVRLAEEIKRLWVRDLS